VRTIATQEDDQKDDNMRVVIFLVEKSCEDNNKVRRRVGKGWHMHCCLPS